MAQLDTPTNRYQPCPLSRNRSCSLCLLSQHRPRRWLPCLTYPQTFSGQGLIRWYPHWSATVLGQQNVLPWVLSLWRRRDSQKPGFVSNVSKLRGKTKCCTLWLPMHLMFCYMQCYHEGCGLRLDIVFDVGWRQNTFSKTVGLGFNQDRTQKSVSWHYLVSHLLNEENVWSK